jgi:hypothetical protein
MDIYVQDGLTARPALETKEQDMEIPSMPRKKSNIPLIVAISLGVALCLGCIILVVVTGLGLSLFNYSAISG